MTRRQSIDARGIGAQCLLTRLLADKSTRFTSASGVHNQTWRPVARDSVAVSQVVAEYHCPRSLLPLILRPHACCGLLAQEAPLAGRVIRAAWKDRATDRHAPCSTVDQAVASGRLSSCPIRMGRRRARGWCPIGRSAPVLLRAPYFGLQHDIRVSPPETRILRSGPTVEYNFGHERVLVRAADLTSSPGALRDLDDCRFGDFFHLMLDDHALHLGGPLRRGDRAVVRCPGRRGWRRAGMASRTGDSHALPAGAGSRRRRRRWWPLRQRGAAR